MEFKEDWEEAKRRFEAWWAGEVIDRVAIQVTAPREGAIRKDVPPPPSLEARWTDVDYVLACAEERFRTTHFGGEAFPCFWPNLGPDVFAAYLGCPLKFAESTTWAAPIINDWEAAASLQFDRNNRWWRLTLQLTEAAVQASRGRYFVGLTDLHGGMDALAALRGQQPLCLDIVDRPHHVERAMAFLTPLWFDIYEALYAIARKALPGCSTWLGVWSPGRMYPVSCDFAALVSPQVFRRFILPDIEAQVNWLDHSMYHLDGPGALPHLDMLLDLPRLNGIQWVPGAGSGSMLKWIPLLRRIQAAGKIIHLSVSPSEVQPLLSELSPRGLMLSTWCPSESQARDLLRRVSALRLPRSQATGASAPSAARSKRPTRRRSKRA